MKTNDRLVFFLLGGSLKPGGTTDPTETLIGHLGDLYHHYLEVLAELFDVAEDPERLKIQRRRRRLGLNYIAEDP